MTSTDRSGEKSTRGAGLLRYVGRRLHFNAAPAGIALLALTLAFGAPAIVLSAPSIVLSAPSIVLSAPSVVLSAPSIVLSAPSIVLSAPSAVAEGPVRILALGDSLTAGYGLAIEESFPARLQAALRHRGARVELINAGVSGDTSAGGRARLDWVLASAKPTHAIVELGANDGLRGLAPAETRANLDAILTRLKAAGVGVLIAGMLAPPNLGREYGDAYNRVFPELARAHGVALYPFFLDGVAARAELLLADGMHPNEKGVREIVRRMIPAVARLIAVD